MGSKNQITSNFFRGDMKENFQESEFVSEIDLTL